MELQLVTKETAILAKELGFDWECSWLMDEQETSRNIALHSGRKFKNKILDVYNIALPEQELLAKWLRDIKDIYITIHVHREGWSFNIHTMKNNRERQFIYSSTLQSISTSKYINTYEDTLEVALIYTLNFLKSKSD